MKTLITLVSMVSTTAFADTGMCAFSISNVKVANPDMGEPVKKVLKQLKVKTALVIGCRDFVHQESGKKFQDAIVIFPGDAFVARYKNQIATDGVLTNTMNVNQNFFDDTSIEGLMLINFGLKNDILVGTKFTWDSVIDKKANKYWDVGEFKINSDKMYVKNK